MKLDLEFISVKEDDNTFKTAVIALDIDDCIFPTDQNWFGRTDDSLKLLEINLKRLNLITEKYDCKVFITSAWYSIMTFKDGILTLNDRGLSRETENKGWYAQETKAFNLIKKYIEKDIIGLSSGCRNEDIEELKKDNNVIIIDDMDLKKHISENCIYCYTHGFIDGGIGYQIEQFLGKEK